MTHPVAARLPLDPSAWPEIVAFVELLDSETPWPREFVIADLRYWTTTGRIPGIEFLRQRWHWSQTDTRRMVWSRDWHDRSLPPPVRAPQAKRGVRSSRATGPARSSARSSER